VVTRNDELVTEHDPLTLPKGLPAPVDDGAADHLPGMAIPPAY